MSNTIDDEELRRQFLTNGNGFFLANGGKNIPNILHHFSERLLQHTKIVDDSTKAITTEMAEFRKTISSATEQTDKQLAALTKAITDASASSNTQAGRMAWLTGVYVFLTLVIGAATVVQVWLALNGTE